MSSDVIVAFDDIVHGTSNVYSSSFVNLALAELEAIALQVVAEPISTAPDHVTVQLETSADGRNWVSKNTTAEVVLNTPLGSVSSDVGYDLGIVPPLALVRIRVQLSGGAGCTARIVVYARQSSLRWLPPKAPGCLLWLRADLGITLAAGSSNVSAWADQSGSNNNASQGTGANQPTYVANAMNNLPALKGDGANYYLVTSAFTIGAAATMVAVVQPSAAPQGAYVRLLDQGISNAYYLGVNSTGAKYKLIVNNTTTPYGVAEGGTVSVPVAPANGNAIITATYASPTGSLYVNGTVVASDSFTAPTPTSLQLYIMQCYANAFSEFWNGYLAEVIVYNRALSAGELTQMHRYLGARYAIGVP